jgi:rubrerythrin
MNNPMNLLEINDKQYRMLKRSYLNAINEGRETLDIVDQNGQPAILTKFAKYWLEAIENNRQTKGLNIYDPAINDHTCKNPNGCNYKWIGKVNPVSCPRCKYRQDTLIKKANP